MEPTAAPRGTFVIPSQKSVACQRRRKHGRTRPIGLYKTSCVEKFRSNLKRQRKIFTRFKSYMIWCKLFCDIGQRAKYVNVRAFQSLCFFLIINFQVNKRMGVNDIFLMLVVLVITVKWIARILVIRYAHVIWMYVYITYIYTQFLIVKCMKLQK